MKKIIAFYFLISTISIVFSQKYLTSYIQSKADSILFEFVKDTSLKKYCYFDTDTYYEYKDILGKSHSQTLNIYKETKGKFVKIDMRWNLVIPYPHCPSLDSICGKTSILLDANLNPINQPNYKFIPDFYWTKDTCYFMTKENAIAIAKSLPLKKGIEPIDAKLHYNDNTNSYYWEVYQYLSRYFRFNGARPNGDIELIHIDAIKGTIIWHGITEYGPVY